MKQTRIDHIFGWFDEDIFTLSIPISILFVILSLMYHPGWYIVVLVAAVYGSLVLIKRMYYRKKARKIGTEYFLVEPNRLYLKIFRKKLNIYDQVQTCWRLHVDPKCLKECRKINDVKERKSEIIRRLRNDMKLLAMDGWDENIVLIGSTYAQFGRLQKKLLGEQGFDVQVYPYPIFQYFKMYVSKARLIREQENMFGKVYIVPDTIEWSTYVLQKVTGK